MGHVRGISTRISQRGLSHSRTRSTTELTFDNLLVCVLRRILAIDGDHDIVHFDLALQRARLSYELDCCLSCRRVCAKDNPKFSGRGLHDLAGRRWRRCACASCGGGPLRGRLLVLRAAK